MCGSESGENIDLCDTSVDTDLFFALYLMLLSSVETFHLIVLGWYGTKHISNFWCSNEMSWVKK